MAELPDSGPPPSGSPASGPPEPDDPTPAHLPAPSATDPLPAQARPRLRPLPLLLALGAGSVALVGLGVSMADRLAEVLYDRHRQQLERQLGAVLGHQLVLGPYRGIGWFGLQLGETRVLP